MHVLSVHMLTACMNPEHVCTERTHANCTHRAHVNCIHTPERMYAPSQHAKCTHVSLIHTCTEHKHANCMAPEHVCALSTQQLQARTLSTCVHQAHTH